MPATDYFSRAFVVNLPEREDRRREISSELSRAGIPLDDQRVSVFPAVRPEDKGEFESVGARGCFLSHLKAWQRAREEGVERLLMIEDDLAISERFGAELEEMVQQLEEVSWDLVYFGHIEPVQSDAPLGFQPWHRPLVTTHFYMAHERVLDRMIESLSAMLERPVGHPEGGPMHVDGAISTFRHFNPDVTTLIATPNLGWQRASSSDISPGLCDRVPLLRPVLHAGRVMKRLLRRP